MIDIALLLAALALALVHLWSPRLRGLDTLPRSQWLSIAGGISVAYIFVHLLPELAYHQSAAFEHASEELYLVALAGLMTFYGLERWAKSHTGSDDPDTDLPAFAFWLHLGAFALYNLLIGYLLPERLEDDGASGLAVYSFAMTLHFIVNDRGLYAHHGPRYLRQGRWVLAVMPFAGLGLSAVTTLPAYAIGGLLAFLGGGVILNVLKEELPEERGSRFWAFTLGAACYAAFLVLIVG